MTREVPNSGQPSPHANREAPAKARVKVLKAGTVVGGRYKLVRVLGQGGFGISYLAEDSQRFDEPCVVKEFKPVSVKDREQLLQKAAELFKREAKALYRIDHPQIPKFMAYFIQAKRLFIVQEYIDGVTYLKLLQARKKQGRAFTEDEVVVWLAQVLPVLAYLHDLGILHRDISPENIMQSRQHNLPVLIDFGMVNDSTFDALLEGDSGEPDSLKNAATIVGKFGYSPPEQVQFGQCNPSTDLYALGVTAIVLLTGKSPRELIDPQTMDWCWQERARASPQLAAILDRTIVQKPQDRFQSVRAVMQALRPLLPADATKLLQEFSSISGEVLDAKAAGDRPERAKFDPEFIERCREELNRCIGPMANLVIEEAVDEHPLATESELVAILADRISSTDLATAFLSHLGKAVQPSPQGEALSEGLLECCRQVLARCIGPMAGPLVEEVLADYPNLDSTSLVDRLADEIPDDRKAAEFRQQMSNCSIRDS